MYFPGHGANKVREGLFISGCEVAENVVVLKKENISHIVTLCPISNPSEEGITRLDLSHIDDSPEEDLLVVFPSCVSFIQQALGEGKNVLVHCAAGISRSSSVVCAFIMYVDHIPFEQALEQVRKARPIVSPNHGFRKQLIMWHEMEYQIEGTKKAHSVYKMEIAAKKLRRGMTLQEMQLPYAPDPQESYYMCSSCQRGLFSDENIITHEKGVDTWGYKEESCNSLECRGYYLQLMSWMKDQIEKGNGGDLICPSEGCGATLGSWSWKPLSCSCHSVICPSFTVLKARVTFSGKW